MINGTEFAVTQQGIIKGDAQQKLGSVGFLIGAILFGVSGFLMPHASNPTSDLQEMLRPLGESQFLTTLASLLAAIGFWAAMLGAAGVYRTITANGAAWARPGFYFIFAGTVLWTASWSLDVATASAVANWMSAPLDSKEATWSVVAALSAFGRGILPLTWLMYWLALALLNVAMIQSGVYPRGLGWAGLSVSIPMLALGVIQIFNARSLTLTLIFSILWLLTALWDMATGIWVARRAW